MCPDHPLNIIAEVEIVLSLPQVVTVYCVVGQRPFEHATLVQGTYHYVIANCRILNAIQQDTNQVSVILIKTIAYIPSCYFERIIRLEPMLDEY
mgnify:CR=1 FL=1